MLCAKAASQPRLALVICIDGCIFVATVALDWCLQHVRGCLFACRPSTARAGNSQSAARQPRPRTTLSRSSSASGVMPAAAGPSLTARGPRASLSSSDLSRGESSSAAPSRTHSQGEESDSSAAAAPMASATQQPGVRSSVPALALGRRATAQAAAGAQGSTALPSARKAAAVPRSKASLPSAQRSQGDLGLPLPSARRGKGDAQADAGAPLPSARRATRDAPSSIPLASARRLTRDEAGQPSYTPRQSTDLSSKSGGRWM